MASPNSSYTSSIWAVRNLTYKLSAPVLFRDILNNIINLTEQNKK